jgi:hypothetical protein
LATSQGILVALSLKGIVCLSSLGDPTCIYTTTITGTSLLKYAILSAWFYVNLCISCASPVKAICNTVPHILHFIKFTCSVYIFLSTSSIFVPDLYIYIFFFFFKLLQV